MKKNKFLAGLLCAALILALLPTTALAAAGYTLYYSSSDGKLHQGSFGGPVYPGSGSTYSGSGTTLTLNGVNFETKAATALRLPGGTTLVLNGTNSVESTAAGVAATYGIYVNGNLTVSGTGSLTAKAGKATDSGSGNKFSFGVYAAGTLSVTSGSLTGVGDAASGDGIIGGNYGMSRGVYADATINVSGGVLTGRSEVPAGSSAGFESTGVRSSSIDVSGGTLTGTAAAAANESYGVHSNNITVSGGQLTANTTGAGGTASALNWPLTLGSGVTAEVKAATNSAGSNATDVDAADTGDPSYKWVRAAVKYTVTLDPTGGAGGTASIVATYGDPMPAITLPTRANCIFNGYFDAQTGGTKYYNSDGTSAKAWDKGVATLYAQWMTVASVTVLPATASVQKGGTQSFTATVIGTNGPAQTVTWTVEGGTASTIDASGNLTVGATETATTLTVRATSTLDTSKSGTATVTVTTPSTVTSVTVSPATASVNKGGSVSFAATVTGTGSPSQTVTWTVEGGTASTIDANGVLTVAAGETATTLTVRATSTLDTSKSGTATVTVTTPPLPPTPIHYQITEGQAGEWTQGSSNGLRFTANADYSKFSSVSVDNSIIAGGSVHH